MTRTLARCLMWPVVSRSSVCLAALRLSLELRRLNLQVPLQIVCAYLACSDLGFLLGEAVSGRRGGFILTHRMSDASSFSNPTVGERYGYFAVGSKSRAR
ncbi:hypothetical protein LIA77_03427 [Sarocladium implicatum]|nr:hypothetical protein LIA77_03427 [Sarocladium implicatum]